VKRDVPEGRDTWMTFVHVSIAAITYFVIIGYVIAIGTKSPGLDAYVGLFIGSAFVFYWIPAGLLTEYYYHGALLRHFDVTDPGDRGKEQMMQQFVQGLIDEFGCVKRTKNRVLERFFLVTGTQLVFDGKLRSRIDVNGVNLGGEGSYVTIVVTPSALELVPRIETLIESIAQSDPMTP
jgi:hypothetical protein